jgi:hypothetical protein
MARTHLERGMIEKFRDTAPYMAWGGDETFKRSATRRELGFRPYAASNAKRKKSIVGGKFEGVGWFGFAPPVFRTDPSSIGRVTACPNSPSLENLTLAGRKRQAVLCCVNPTLNSHPETAAPFLEPHHLSENNNASAVGTVSDGELRKSGRIDWPWCFRIEPAVSVTAVALKIIPGLHACHSSPRGVMLTMRVCGRGLGDSHRTDSTLSFVLLLFHETSDSLESRP